MVNVPLLRKTLEHITNHQDEWSQKQWFGPSLRSACGTAGCLAGHAAVLSGVELEYGTYNNGYGRPPVWVPLGDKSGLSLQDVATRELGLTPYAASILFMTHNSLADLTSSS